MSGQPRRWLYLLTAASVLGALAVQALVSAEPAEEARPGRASVERPRQEASSAGARWPELPPEVPPLGTEPPNPAVRARARTEGRRVAVRFLKALLRYERGQNDAPIRRDLRESATEAMTQQLLSRPARAAASTGPARLLHFSLYGPFADQLKASVRLVSRQLGQTLVELALRRHGGRWRVARVEP